MREIIETGVIESGSALELTKAVNDAIAKGWQPLGGVSVVYLPKTSSMLYSLLMVKYAQE